METAATSVATWSESGCRHLVEWWRCSRLSQSSRCRLLTVKANMNTYNVIVVLWFVCHYVFDCVECIAEPAVQLYWSNDVWCRSCWS